MFFDNTFSAVISLWIKKLSLLDSISQLERVLYDLNRIYTKLRFHISYIKEWVKCFFLGHLFMFHWKRLPIVHPKAKQSNRKNKLSIIRRKLKLQPKKLSNIKKILAPDWFRTLTLESSLSGQICGSGSVASS